MGFNPDEEIGMGAHHFDVEKFGCQWAYTMDGGDIGDLEYENFNAAGAKVTIRGVSVHTGYAKGKMINASRLACEFNSHIPDTDIPETTEGYEGFYHLLSINSHCEEAKLSYIIRDHDRKKFEQRKDFMEHIAEEMNAKYGEGTVTIDIKDQYYNMKEKIDPNMYVIDIVLKAMQESGVRRRWSLSVAAPTARSCRSVACPARISSPAESTSMALTSSSPSRSCKRPWRSS